MYIYHEPLFALEGPVLEDGVPPLFRVQSKSSPPTFFHFLQPPELLSKPQEQVPGVHTIGGGGGGVVVGIIASLK